MIWTLIIVTSIKYVSFAMRVDNDGEGGILALMSLLGVKRQHRPAIVAVGLFGAALIYGDGAITPAISVLSALEGLNIVTSTFQPYILPAAVVILVALFAIQPLGTTRIGRAFGPIMALWFLVMAVLGLWGIVQHPAVLFAIDPRAGLAYLRTGGLTGFLVLGGVFLMRDGRRGALRRHGPFRREANSPSLVGPRLSEPRPELCRPGGARSRRRSYGGQHLLSAVSAGHARAAGAAGDDRNDHRQPVHYYRRLLDDAAGDPARMAAAAAIIQTSERGYGQIYVGAVNWLLMIVTLGLTIGFGKSDNLAAAYGIAVSATMLMTTALLFIAMREIWRWTLPAAAAIASALLHRRCGLPRGQSRQDRRRRIRAVAARRRGLRRDAGLAHGRAGGLGPAPRNRGPDRELHGADRRRQDSARAGHRCVSYPDRARRAAGDGVAREAQSRAA